MTDREKLIEVLTDDDCPLLYMQGDVGGLADFLIANGVTIQNWIPVTERLPDNFASVLGYMTDAGNFPPVRECYTVGNAFFFPALGDFHPVSSWCEMPKPPKNEMPERNDNGK